MGNGCRMALGLSLFAVALGTKVEAQNGPGGGLQMTRTAGGEMDVRVAGKAGDLTTLVREEAVQKDLKLTAKQKEKLTKLMGELDTRRKEAVQQSVRTAEDAGQGGKAAFGAAGAIAGSFQNESEQVIAQVLERRQITRLKQIALQQEGLVAVARDEIADKINLSIPQRERIRAILDEMRAAQTELMQSLTGGTGAVMIRATSKDADGAPKLDKGSTDLIKKMSDGRERIRKATLQQINKLLTKKQGAAFTRLMGEPFDFKTLSPLAQGRFPLLAKPPGEGAAAPASSSNPGDEPAGSTGPPHGPRRKQSRASGSQPGGAR